MDNQSSQAQQKAVDQLRREQRLRAVKVGRYSHFWELMTRSIEKLLEADRKLLDKYEKQGIRETDIPFYNRICGRVEILEKFLELPDTMIKNNESIVNRAMNGVKEFAEPLYRSFNE